MLLVGVAHVLHTDQPLGNSVGFAGGGALPFPTLSQNGNVDFGRDGQQNQPPQFHQQQQQQQQYQQLQHELQHAQQGQRHPLVQRQTQLHPQGSQQGHIGIMQQQEQMHPHMLHHPHEQQGQMHTQRSEGMAEMAGVPGRGLSAQQIVPLSLDPFASGPGNVSSIIRLTHALAATVWSSGVGCAPKDLLPAPRCQITQPS